MEAGDGTRMSVRDAATYLRLPVETVYKYVRSGALPARKERTTWVLDREAVDRWMLAHQNAAVARLPPAVLVVDDESPIRELMRRWLAAAGYRVEVAVDGADGEDKLRQASFDLVLTDLRMPNVDGAQLIGRIQRMPDRPEVVVITAYYDGELMRRTMALGTFRLVKKPARRDEVLAVVRATLG